MDFPVLDRSQLGKGRLVPLNDFVSVIKEKERQERIKKTKEEQQRLQEEAKEIKSSKYLGKELVKSAISIGGLLTPWKQVPRVEEMTSLKEVPKTISNSFKGFVDNVSSGMLEGMSGGRLKAPEPQKPTVWNYFVRDFTKGVASIPGAFIEGLNSFSEKFGLSMAANDIAKAQRSIVNDNIDMTNRLIEKYKKETDLIKYVGNIDLSKQPKIQNSDGSISTIRSIGINEDGKEIVIPTVRPGLNRIMTNQEAIDWYHKTNKYLGKFNSVDEANQYAIQLHNIEQKKHNID